MVALEIEGIVVIRFRRRVEEVIRQAGFGGQWIKRLDFRKQGVPARHGNDVAGEWLAGHRPPAALCGRRIVDRPDAGKIAAARGQRGDGGYVAVSETDADAV